VSQESLTAAHSVDSRTEETMRFISTRGAFLTRVPLFWIKGKVPPQSLLASVQILKLNLPEVSGHLELGLGY